MTEASTTNTPQDTKIDYKGTLNLPETPFKMKAGAREREPEIQAFWHEQDLYQQLLDARKNAPRFLLHDGPPYLSAPKIHIGTALNKILKDIVIRYQWQRGHYTPYVPGYDGHGLPIENAILQADKKNRELPAVELRKACRAFALQNLKGQEAHFKRLGILGNWENPYVTVNGPFEAVQIDCFWQMYNKGYVYKGLKPVYWDTIFQTALAEAEVEYADVTSPSIYVKFQLTPESIQKLPASLASEKDVALVIWTTTPWTIPANLGLCLNETLDYVFIQTAQWGIIGVAEALLESVANACELGEFKIIDKINGKQLENLEGTHPLYNRASKVILGDHVTTEAGTGVVHTAPGHGMEDYLVGKKYGLDVLCPVDASGNLTLDAGERLAGKNVLKDASAEVIAWLTENNALLKEAKLSHSYPHSWRSHKPVIYRATEQWFISIDKIRDLALSEIKNVSWHPERGENRITSMVENRGDWCISRQRSWGVPIPVFYCESCNQELLNADIINNVKQLFHNETSDAWWEHDAKALMGKDYACESCGHTQFKKEMDIMDVWFDSGVTHTAVVEARSEELGHLPVELYLEGSDQHRGWFQSALLTSVMTNGKAPYKSVLTHGFVLDEHGRKMSKSLGNVIDPEKIINEYGADVLRLWVASVDFTNDVKIGGNFLSQLAEVYKKVRNTIRFILGNLNGFDPKADKVSPEQFSFLDKHILGQLNSVIYDLTTDFDKYSLHSYYQKLQNLCINDLSALYFDVTKDILYTAHPKSTERLAVQTVLYETLCVLLPLLVPVMPHLAEDIWQSIPDNQKPNFGFSIPPKSVLLAPWPERFNYDFLEGINKLPALYAFREISTIIKTPANKELEAMRAQGQIGSSLEAQVLIKSNLDWVTRLNTSELNSLEKLLIVSSLEIIEDASVPKDNIVIEVTKADGTKCTRCWRYDTTVGSHHDHAEICSRCHDVVTNL